MSDFVKSSGFFWVLMPIEAAKESYLWTDDEVERLDEVQLGDGFGNFEFQGHKVLLLPNNGFDVLQLKQEGMVGESGVLILLAGTPDSLELVFDSRREEWQETSAEIDLPSGKCCLVDAAKPTQLSPPFVHEFAPGRHRLYEFRKYDAHAVWLEPLG